MQNAVENSKFGFHFEKRFKRSNITATFYECNKPFASEISATQIILYDSYSMNHKMLYNKCIVESRRAITYRLTFDYM